MAITDENSVLILGAGSSADFQLPLGGALIEEISKQVLETGWSFQANSWGDKGNRPPNLVKYIREPSSGLNEPVWAAIAWKCLNSDGQCDSRDLDAATKRAIEIGNIARNQTSETVDDFISQNPSLSSEIKLFVSAILISKLMIKSGNTFHKLKRQNITARHLQGSGHQERNWIHLLINIIRHSIENPLDPPIPIKIISFNYDGILESVLEDQFFNSEKFASASANGMKVKDYIEISHVHGICGTVPPTTSNLWKLASDWSDKIWVINEDESKVPEEVSRARQKARTWISGAKNIYSAGFAFSRPNCRKILALDENQSVNLSYLNFNDDIGIDIAVEQSVHPTVWKFRDRKNSPKIIRAAGTKERPLSISNWIRAGHLGEMPG